LYSSSSNPVKKGTGNLDKFRANRSADLCDLSSFTSGYYVYAEASYPAVQGDKASLQSKVFSALDNGCLRFFYNMHGSTMGALRVFITENGGEQLLWEKAGPQGERWKEAKVDYSSPFSYQVRI